MAKAFVPPQQDQPFGASSVLSDVWNEAQRTFRVWVDQEIGAETALESEAAAHQALTDAEMAPARQNAVQGFNFTTTVLLLLAGLGVVIFLTR